MTVYTVIDSNGTLIGVFSTQDSAQVALYNHPYYGKIQAVKLDAIVYN